MSATPAFQKTLSLTLILWTLQKGSETLEGASDVSLIVFLPSFRAISTFLGLLVIHKFDIVFGENLIGLLLLLLDVDHFSLRLLLVCLIHTAPLVVSFFRILRICLLDILTRSGRVLIVVVVVVWAACVTSVATLIANAICWDICISFAWRVASAGSIVITALLVLIALVLSVFFILLIDKYHLGVKNLIKFIFVFLSLSG